MTSEDYMMDRYWDHEIDMIIEEMREKLYDLRETMYISTSTCTYKSDVVVDVTEEELYVTDTSYGTFCKEQGLMSEYKDMEEYREFHDVKNPNE